MTLIEKTNAAIAEALNGDYELTDLVTGETTMYNKGSSNMNLDNAVFVDMFPDEVTDVSNFHGFDRTRYQISKLD